MPTQNKHIPTCILRILLLALLIFPSTSLLITAESNSPPPPPNREPPTIVEIIQDDETAFIYINSLGDKQEHYYDQNHNEIKTIITDARGNVFQTEYDSNGNVIKQIMPDEIIGEDIHTQDQIIEETNDKGILGILHYDTKDRLLKITEYFVFGYQGVTEYQYHDKMQLVERDGHRGYEWVVKKETATLVKDNDVKASITKEFDKDRTLLKKQTQGITLMFPVISLIAKVYGYEISKEDIERG